MKQNDIALLVLIICLSVAASVFVGGKVIKPSKDRSTKVEVVERISSVFPPPDPTVFNDQALNPTREIKIGNDSNNKPITSQ